MEINRFPQCSDILQNFLEDDCAHTLVAKRRQHGKALQLYPVFGFPPASRGHRFVIQEKQVMMGRFLVIVFQSGINALFFDEYLVSNGGGLFRERFILK